MINTKTDFKNKIKDIRKQMGLTQSQFANKYNIPVTTFKKWETGERVPPVYVIELLFFKINHED